jgi:hypothetical protein
MQSTADIKTEIQTTSTTTTTTTTRTTSTTVEQNTEEPTNYAQTDPTTTTITSTATTTSNTDEQTTLKTPTTTTSLRPLLENIVCTFDEFSFSNTEICGGLGGFNIELGIGLSDLRIDNLPSVSSTNITDFTSLS